MQAGTGNEARHQVNYLARHRTFIASLGCLLAKQGVSGCAGTTELHHVAEGSGIRNEWALVPLCEAHHRGQAGLHGMGTKAFIRLYRPPGDSEFGLLIWLLESMAHRRAA